MVARLVSVWVIVADSVTVADTVISTVLVSVTEAILVTVTVTCPASALFAPQNETGEARAKSMKERRSKKNFMNESGAMAKYCRGRAVL